MAHNPFDSIELRLTNIERLLIDLPDMIKPELKQSEPDLLRYIPIQDIFKRKICSKPTFYAHLKNGEFTLYKFGNKSFVDRTEFERAFHGVKLNGNKT